MPQVNSSIDETGNKILDVTPEVDESSFTLATANTYVDKNIIINLNTEDCIKKDEVYEGLIIITPQPDKIISLQGSDINLISYLSQDGKGEVNISAEGNVEVNTDGHFNYNNKEVVTADVLENYISNEEVDSFIRRADRIDEVANSIRGRSILNITTLPTTSVGSEGSFNYNFSKTILSIQSEAKVEEVFVGDVLHYNGNLYIIGYLDNETAYLQTAGNIRGAQGEQGIQGIQGPQGPKGDPGEGYFIVTDEDYSKIADFVEEKSYHSYQRPDSSEPIRPNIFYDFGPQYHLEITFEAPQSIYRSNEYMFQFESPSDRPTTLVMPADVRWCYDPIIEAGKIYQVSVLNGLGVICGA